MPSRIHYRITSAVVAISIIMTSSLSAFAQTTDYSSRKQLTIEMEFNEHKVKLHKDLMTKHGKKVDAEIKTIRGKLDKELDAAVAEMEIDARKRRAGNQQFYLSDLSRSYVERYGGDYNKTPVGKVLDSEFKNVAQSLSEEEKYVLQIKVAQLLSTKEYGDKYNRRTIFISALVGLSLGLVVSYKISEPGMANSFMNTIGGMLVTGILSLVGGYIGSLINMDTNSVEMAENLQATLTEKSDQIKSDADAILESMVKKLYFSDLNIP